MRREPAGEFCSYGVVPYRLLLACALVFAPPAALFSWSQAHATGSAAESSAQLHSQAGRQFQGQTVGHISFEGVSADRLVPLSGHLPQMEGQPFNAENVSESLRQLYATGLYETIQVDGPAATDAGVDLVFRGTPRIFIGTVGVDGAKGATINTQLSAPASSQPGTRFTQAKLDQRPRADAPDPGRERLPRAADYAHPHPAPRSSNSSISSFT